MKGFETGVMMRTKQTTIADFGCHVPDMTKSRLATLLEHMSLALDGVKMLMPNDLDAEEGFEMVSAYVEGLANFASVFDPNTSR